MKSASFSFTEPEREATESMDIEIHSADRADTGFIRGQRVVPGSDIERIQDDLLREAAKSSGPDRPSETTMDDSSKSLSK